MQKNYDNALDEASRFNVDDQVRTSGAALRHLQVHSLKYGTASASF